LGKLYVYYQKANNAILITAALAAEWDEKRRIGSKMPKPSDIVKAPKAFKKEMQWNTWRESLNTY
jgi:hypothetical protein